MHNLAKQGFILYHYTNQRTDCLVTRDSSIINWIIQINLRVLFLRDTKMPSGKSPSDLKKNWRTPELIILVRSRPEEAVLVICKHPSQFNTGPGFDNGCKYHGNACYDQNNS